MNKKAVAQFAHDFRNALELDGTAALDCLNWASGFSVLGFKMDCGASYEERFRLVLGDADGIEGALERVDDPLVLGNAIFSQCRYFTHWSGGFGEEVAAWLIAALAKLEELMQTGSCSGMCASYRFADTAERAILSFCARALPEERLPNRIEYSVADTGAMDAYVDEVHCFISLSNGDVSLAFEIVQTAWRHLGQTDEELAPSAENVRAKRTVEDEKTGGRTQLAWNDDEESWEPVQK